MNFDDDNTIAFSAATLEKFDEICVRFEKQWQANTPGSIEEELVGFEGQSRNALLLELILLDIEYRIHTGNPSTRLEYESRFPDEVDVVEMAFRGSNKTDDIPTDTVGYTQNFLPPEKIGLTQSFNIRQLHARGGIGVVYLARDEKLNRDVAVKFPRKTKIDCTEQFRLQREAEITGRLQHPGIVPVLAANDAQNEMPCFVMQFVQGETFKDAIRKLHAERRDNDHEIFHSLQFRQLLQRFVAICETVSYAHKHGVIHRDIKPSNIMLGRFGETYLLDWGLAKIVGEEESIASDPLVDPDEQQHPLWLSSSSTRPGQPIGTPEYASPEQIMGRIAEHEERSDVYSLGATLYNLITGIRPIDSDELTDLTTAKALRKIKKPKVIAKTIPRELEAVCLKAMAFELPARYPTSQQMANDIERYLADEPISVLRDSWAVKMRRWGRQHPRTLVGIAASVFVTVVSLAIGSYLLGLKNLELTRFNVDLIQARNAQKLAQSETMTALSSLTDNAIERWLAQEEEMSSEDREFLESILAQYQKFADARPDQAVAVETKVDGYFQVSQLQRVLGNTDDAIDTGLTGLAFIDELDGNLSDTMLDLESKIQSITSVMLANTGEFERAETMIESSIKTAKHLVERNPDSSVSRFNYCQRLDYRGNIFTQIEDFQSASDCFRKTLTLLDEIPQPEQLNQVQLLRQKAATTHNLGLALLNLKQFDAARTRLESSIKLFQELTDQSSKIADQVDHFRAMSTLGIVNQKLRQHTVAFKYFSESIGNLEAIIESYPALVDPYLLVGNAYYEMARIHRDLGVYEKSLAFCEQSLPPIDRGLAKSPIETKLLAQRYKTIALQATVLEKLNRRPEAAECFRDLLVVAEKLFRADEAAFRRRIVDALLLTSNNLIRQRKYAESEKFARRALKIIEETDDVVAKQGFHRDEMGCHQLLGWCLMFTHKKKESFEHWQQIIELTGGNPTILQNGESMLVTAQVYGSFCQASFEPADALQNIQELATNKNLSSIQIYNLSCAAAVASKTFDSGEQRTLAESKSLELLELAVLAGHFPNQQQLDVLKANPSFENLLDHPEFKRIEALISAGLAKQK